VLFRPNTEHERRLKDRVAQLADQEKENLVLTERNKTLAESLADELNKPSSRPSKSKPSSGWRPTY
jgi:phage-related minor tail protein